MCPREVRRKCCLRELELSILDLSTEMPSSQQLRKACAHLLVEIAKRDRGIPANYRDDTDSGNPAQHRLFERDDTRIHLSPGESRDCECRGCVAQPFADWEPRRRNPRRHLVVE